MSVVGTCPVQRTVARNAKEVNQVAEVRSRCGMCLEVKRICPICCPDVRSAKALHEELPKGWYAHCERCHRSFLDMQDELRDGIVTDWPFDGR